MCFSVRFLGAFRKKGYESNFTDRTLTAALRRTKHTMYALGGISTDNIERAHELGFTGVALLGAIWHEEKDPVEEFLRARQLCEKLGDSKPVKLAPLS